jgi:hypothetical protein
MNLAEALSILKPNGNTAEALKTAYRTACKKYHPDHGGDLEMMKLVNEAYAFLKTATWGKDAEKEHNNSGMAENLKKKWDAIKNLKGIHGEIIGTWIWVSGKTYAHKETFKAEGFRWSKPKSSWYWHEEKDYKKTSKKMFSMDDIRIMWGSSPLTSTGLKELTA